ncbi:hypothetical protein DM01DRAFT_1209121 [Hesseltinella vesiculosa]|uniref:Uncharacterized protein n=1 Tax=Hesseltinella vesiculosa TaxID=101127 RepID=A0A1X2GQE5_9FUNG|nr:hypothetical protein DM01DRAFT_1209121 [Hesseltinella vesiculosa]
MTLLGFHQLGLSFQIGSLSLTRVPSDQHHQAWKRWLDITTSQSQSMAENQDALAKENALLTESNNKLHTMNEDLALQKTKNDRDIIGKFTELLNAKKRKIRELQAQLNHLPAEPALDHPPPSPPPARPRKKQKQRATTTASLSSPLSATQPVQHTSSASSAMKPAIASSSATSASSLGPSSSHISKASSSTAPVKISSFTVISDDDLDGDNLDDFDSLLNTSQAKTRKMANPKSKLNGKKPV